MNSHDVLDAIEAIAATGARTGKEELMATAITDPLFARVVKLAYDTFITFGITPPKVKKFGHLGFDIGTAWLWADLDGLANRTITGNAAKALVKDRLESMDEKSSQLLYRILSKDLRAGFGKNTVNRVLPGTIVTFDVMLSKEYEAKRVKVWPVAVEPKLDGLRAMSLVTGGQSKAFSRVGNHFPALDCLAPAVVAMVEKAHDLAGTKAQMGSPIHEVYFKMLGGAAGPSAGVDAEAITGGFNKTSGDVKRKSVSADDAILHVFDIVPYALLTGDEPIVKIPYKVRRALVEFVVACADENAPIVHTPMELAGSDDEIVAIYQKHRDAGLEGAMVKPLDSQYVKKKTHAWMKMKACETEDLRITGWFEGDVGTRLEGKFAGFIVDRINPADAQIVKVRVGGGFKHAQLEEFDAACREDDAELERNGATIEDPSFDGQPRGLTRLIEVEYHEVTPDGSLRHPRFVRFRDDKDETMKAAA